MSKLNKKIRPKVRGKFIFVGQKKLYIKGVTYGTFSPNYQGELYPEPKVVEQDFAQMAANGINSIRTYTVPPRWLLDLAQANSLYVMIGLPWEQHIAFLDDPKRVRDIQQRVRAGTRACAEHPALLCYAIGNEIPSSIVRWYGRNRVEGLLKLLYETVKAEDPEGLTTYVNYPTTEYLRLPFVDFVCFNVYLESPNRLEAYFARLQNLAENRPLVIAEIGLDSLRNGEEFQAQTLDWQVRTTFESGCAGCFVFAWTDEWYRGGFNIEDWDFGLTNRQRLPKPALQAVRQAFARVPFPADLPWPRISVAVCSYNGASTIGETLEALQHLNYPDYEVIVVDDGSTNGVAKIAKEYGVKVIVHSQNQGLSCARNTALASATGDIIAYIDDDAYPDPHWLTYLATTFLKIDCAGVGGPNIPPPGDGPIADCVANSPGGPIHVLVDDREAEHVPGCNMAFWKSHLQEIGGFDPRFRAAGDDVDICWRLQEQGRKIWFSHAALVWHHRRNSVRAYWKQQKGYGRAEALLEQKWPERYNAVGHLSWSGRLYGKGLVQILGWRLERIYHGIWGSAPFQSVYQRAPGLFPWLPAMPEWNLVILILAVLSVLGAFCHLLSFAIPWFAIAIILPVAQSVISVSQADFTIPTEARFSRLKLQSLTVLLYLLQPWARLWGRLENGLTPWRRRSIFCFRFPRPRQLAIWSETWQSSEEWLTALERSLRDRGTIFAHGGDFDCWDLEVRGGLFAGVRVLMAIEEHGSGNQLVRFRAKPRVAPTALVTTFFLAFLFLISVFECSAIVAIILGSATVWITLSVFLDCSAAMDSVLRALKKLDFGQITSVKKL